MEGRNFIFTGLQPWDMPIGSNARDIACEVARRNRVLYVDTPLAFGEGRRNERPDIVRRTDVVRKREAPLRRINDNLFVLDLPFRVVPVNGLPDGRLFDTVNRINNRRIFRYVGKTAARLGFDSPIHFIDNDIYRSFYAKEYLCPAASVYYRRDDVLSVDYWKRHGRRLEPALIAKSDVVVANSEYLAEGARDYNTLCSDIGQGIDLSAFDGAADARRVPEMDSVPRPVIGYLGHITSLRLDADLIYSLASHNPSLSFVLAGPEDEVFRSHGLHGLGNVHFTGPVPKDRVPYYIAAFDICINPQSVNKATLGNYPRKIDEYLALGKPVVATRTPGMEIFGGHVFLCENADEYDSAFRRILSGERPAPPDECICFAHTHTWEASVGRLYRAIENFLRP